MNLRLLADAPLPDGSSPDASGYGDWEELPVSTRRRRRGDEALAGHAVTTRSSKADSSDRSIVLRLTENEAWLTTATARRRGSHVTSDVILSIASHAGPCGA
jgi:hypothetical protein